MAAGVQQPGGGTTTIFVEDNAHADAGGDGSYSFADISAKYPLLFRARGTTPQSYESDVTVQLGDGTGTAVTTLKDSRCDVHFAATKTLLTAANSAGFPNRTIELGKLATSADGSPIGYDGCRIYCNANPGSATGLQCNLKLYDSFIGNYNATAATSRVFLSPSFLTGYSEIIDSKFFTLAGTQTIGSPTGSINRIRRMASIGLGAGAVNGHIVQFNAPDSEDLQFYWPNGDYKYSTGAYVVMGNPHFFGPSSIGDTRSTFASILKNPLWSRNCPKFEAAPFGEEWFGFSVLVLDENGAPLSGARVEVYDPYDNRIVVNTVTNSLGWTDFLPLQSVAESPPFITGHETAPFRNCLMVNGHNNDGVMHEHTPFTLYVNRDLSLSTRLTYRKKFAFPYSLFLTTQKQYAPISMGVVLPKRTAGSGAEDWREEYA